MLLLRSLEETSKRDNCKWVMVLKQACINMSGSRKVLMSARYFYFFFTECHTKIPNARISVLYHITVLASNAIRMWQLHFESLSHLLSTTNTLLASRVCFFSLSSMCVSLQAWLWKWWWMSGSWLIIKGGRWLIRTMCVFLYSVNKIYHSRNAVLSS